MNNKDWQAFSVEITLTARRNLDAKDDEIDELRQQLEQAQARVAMLEEFVADAQQDAWRALDPDYVPPDVAGAMKSLLHRAATITQEVDPDDIEPSAWLLRKEAETVEALKFPVTTRKMWSGTEVNDWLNRKAQDMRKQADEIERSEDGG